MNLPLVLGAIAVVLIIKILTTGISLKTLGYKLPVAASVALMLAQIGEFSFVLERAGREVGLTPMGWGAAGSQTFIAATVVLMVATPFLMKIGDSLSKNRKQIGTKSICPMKAKLPNKCRRTRRFGRPRDRRRLRSGGALSGARFERLEYSVHHHDA
jgi:predicted Kef-type K+ transport protein